MIDAFNSVSTNVWALMVLGLGVVLFVSHHDAAGQMVVGGALGLLQHK